MNEINIVGQVIGGNVGHLLIRQKSNIDLELGDLLIAENDNSFLLLKVFELKYGSQVDDSSIEMASGLILEGHSESSFIDSDLRNYIVASVKAIANVKGTTVTIPKTMPSFFAKIRIFRQNSRVLPKFEFFAEIGDLRQNLRPTNE